MIRPSLPALAAVMVAAGLNAPAGMAPAQAAGRQTAAASPASWSTQPPSGFKRQEVSYIAAGGKFYLAGGRSTEQQVFDPVAGTWARVAPLPAALDHIQTVALNGLVYYVGGLSGYPKGSSFGDVYVYHPVGDFFSAAAPLPAGRDRGAGGIGVYQGRIYLAGGFHSGHSVAWFDSYDPNTNTWTALPDLPGARDHVSAAVVNGRFYVIGGRQFGVAFRATNEAFDFATGSWITGLAPLPTLRSGAATAVFGSEIAVIGGEGGGIAHTENEAYDTATNSWRTLTPMPTGRHGIQAAMGDNGVAYIADGGTKPGGASPTDIQEALTVAAPASSRPDCRVRQLNETRLTGDNIYGTTGVGQTRQVTVAAGTKMTFVLSAQNDGSAVDTVRLAAPGSQPGFTVHYLAGLSGTTDVTAQVVAGTYPAKQLAPGGRQVIRLEVTVSATVASGASATWLASTTSTVSAVTDRCGGQVTVS